MIVTSKATLLRSHGKNLLIWFFLLLATAHCTRSIFYSTYSAIDWKKYVAGQAAMPYQGRVGMMPILRWSENSKGFNEFAERAQHFIGGTRSVERMSVEKLVSFLTSFVALLAMVFASAWYAAGHAYRPWWLAPILVLMIVSLSLGLRSEMNMWFPYDLPHAALFGMACLCILEGWWLPAIPLFLLDMPVRESGIFLLVPGVATLCFHASKRKIAAVLAGAAALFAYAFMLRMSINHRFASNPSETGSYLHENLRLVSVFHWPQLLSAGGYLVLFVLLEQRRLSARERVFLWGCLACIPVTLYFAIWTETRVWLEWTMAVAMLAAAEWSNYMSGRRAQTLEEHSDLYEMPRPEIVSTPYAISAASTPAVIYGTSAPAERVAGGGVRSRRTP